MATIKLKHGLETLVDDIDLPATLDYSWYADYDGYHWYVKARIRGTKTSRVRLHTLIASRMLGISLADARGVDHINRDTLDNRRENLRLVSHSDNCLNRSRSGSPSTSGVTGVSWFKPRRTWAVRISVGGDRVFIGTFKTLEEATEARRLAEVKYYGQAKNPR